MRAPPLPYFSLDAPEARSLFSRSYLANWLNMTEDTLTATFAALADPTRREILARLR